MPAEERGEARFAALEEVARGEGEEAGEQQEDHQEHVRHRRGEIGDQLALGDGADGSHRFTVSGSVMRRNTSSSSPRSLYMPSTFQPSRFTSSTTSCAQLAGLRLVRAGRCGNAPSRSCTLSERRQLLQRSAVRRQRHRAGEVRHVAQLFRRAVGDDAAAVDDDRARAGGVDLLEDVGREHDRLVAAELADQVAHLVLLVRVEAVGRLVHDQHLGIVDQRLREAGAVLVALGQRVDRLAQHRFRGSSARPRARRPFSSDFRSNRGARPRTPGNPAPSCPGRRPRSPAGSRSGAWPRSATRPRRGRRWSRARRSAA